MNVSAADFMTQGTAVSFHGDTVLNAALYSTKHRLPLADCPILQISKEYHATLWTQYADLKGHPSVQY